MRVRGVMTRQGRDISDLLNEAAGDYADSYTGVLIAESGLNEQALREGKWPDYSAGLSQVIAANLGYGTYAQRPTDAALKTYREHMFDPANAIREGWKWYSAALHKHTDPLYAALAYNVGNSRSTTELMELVASSPEHARRLEHYRKALKEAERYRITMAVDDAVNASKEIKEKLHQADDYAIAASEPFVIGEGSAVGERVQGSKGTYWSSPVDGWTLHGPFGGAEA